MNIDVVSKVENKLLERQEIGAIIMFDGKTPTRKEIRTDLGGKLGANPDLIVLREVASEFGIKKLTIQAHLYENADLVKKREPNYILVRDGFAEKTPKKKKVKAAPAAKKKE